MSPASQWANIIVLRGCQPASVTATVTIVTSRKHRQVPVVSLTELSWVEQGLTSHQTHHRSYWGQVFTGQMTQPTVSQHMSYGTEQWWHRAHLPLLGLQMDKAQSLLHMASYLASQRAQQSPLAIPSCRKWVGDWVGLSGWLHAEMIYPWMVSHLSTNWTRYRATDEWWCVQCR